MSTRLLIRCPPRFGTIDNRGFRRWGGRNGVKWKCSKYCFGHFLICLKLLILKISGVEFCWKWCAISKRFWWHLEIFGWASQNKTREIWFFGSGGVAFMGAWLSGENGQAVNFRKLVLLFSTEGTFSKCLRRQGENTLYFPIYQQSCKNFQSHPFSGQVVTLCKHVFLGSC